MECEKNVVESLNFENQGNETENWSVSQKPMLTLGGKIPTKCIFINDMTIT